MYELARKPTHRKRGLCEVAGAHGKGPPRVGSLALVAPHRLHLFLELHLQRFQVERRTLLHRWVLEEGLGSLADLLLHVDKAPELIDEPVIEGQRSDQSSTLEGIEPQIDQDWPVDLHRPAQPALRLIDEAVFIVVDADGPERRFGEVEDLVPL